MRGEVWHINFAPSVGAEIQKIRPAVVMNMAGIGRLPLHVVVPITNWRSEYARFAWFVHLNPAPSNGLTKESGADGFQVKSVSEARFVQKIGIVTTEELAAIAEAVAVVVGFTP